MGAGDDGWRRVRHARHLGICPWHVTLFANDLEGVLSQGDTYRPDWADDRTPREGSVIVLSEGCDIDKAPTVLVATVELEADTERQLFDNVRAGRVWHGLHLEGLTPGGWVNLRKTRPLDKELLSGRLDRRIASMLAPARAALAGKMFSFLTRSLPRPVRYYVDEQGCVWSVAEVTRKHVARVEDQVRQRLQSPLNEGWLCFQAPTSSRRLNPVPHGWQFASDDSLKQMLATADGATTPTAHVLTAEEIARRG
jgi:hypothetical protein